MINTYTFTQQQLTSLLFDTIEMFIEYRDNHNKSEEISATLSVSEMIQGLDATIELVRSGVLSKEEAGMIL